MDLKDKVALVTGSSSGIGEAVALLLAKNHVKVVINSRKSTENGKKVVDKIEKLNGSAIFVKADLTAEKDVEFLFSEIYKVHKTVDILINNAGESTPGEFDDLDNWDYQIKNNLMSCVLVTKEFLKVENSNQRKIINISSIYGSGLGGNLDYMSYSAAKAAINNLTINLAKKYAPQIMVNAIMPGYTQTPPWGEMNKELEADLKKETKIGRFVYPYEIAHTVKYLLENDAITGQIITVDGGTLLKDLY